MLYCDPVIAWSNQGLKLFKQDGLSVWKYFVPHRDPSLLPRQWRIATGTQKSYRKSEAIKEKTRLYEAKRRRLKASMADGHTLSEKEIHRLPFHESEDQLSSYYSMNRHTAASGTCHLGAQLQKESTFSKSQHFITMKDRISGIDAPLDLFSVDFHPLLRRTDNATADHGMVSSVDPAGGASLCHHEKENELDLDIHLYSVTQNEKTRQAGDSSMHQFNKSGSPRFQPSMGKGIDADIGCCEKDVNSLEVVQMPNDCLSQCSKDYDESNLDIIMEQEELSDSDD
ncbi:unnamed protein product [Musa acuminata subsp. burmannicoides]